MSFFSRSGGGGGVSVPKYAAVEMKSGGKDFKSSDTATATATATTIEAPAVKEAETKKKAEEPPSLSLLELMVVLRPFFWPNQGTDGAFVNRIRALSTWIFVVGSKVCSLYSPFFLASATNAAIDHDWHKALIDVVSYCVLRFFVQVFKELQSLIYLRVKQQASIELAQLTFSHIHKLSLNWHLTKQTGGVVKSMDRGADAANSLVSYLFLYLIPALAECLAVVILFFSQYKQWELGVVVFSGVALYCIVSIIITQWRKKFRELQNKNDNDYHAKATDSIINFETVKYFTAEAFELKRFSDSVIKYQQYNVNTQYSLSFLNLIQQFLLWGTMLGAMLLSTKAVVNGRMSIGAWVAVQSWVSSVFTPLSFLGSIYSMIVQSMIDIRNLSQLLTESPDIVDMRGAKSLMDEVKDKAGGVSIELDRVNFHYPDQLPSSGLRDVSFVVPAGKTVAIVGSTGAGKTTISRMFFRFYDPLSGRVAIDGKDIRHYTQKSVRDLIGVVPQDTVLFNDTIMYNIRYGNRDASDEEVYSAAASAQIRTFVEGLPEKWNTVVGERGLKLSGGEKQRVAIARCLLKNPPIVLLDEATSALDTITEHSIQEALATLGKNRTVIVIAHRLSTVRSADSIVVMEKGAVLENGTHNDLLALNGSYSKLWNMQHDGTAPDNHETTPLNSNHRPNEDTSTISTTTGGSKAEGASN